LEHFWDAENKTIKLDTDDEIIAGCLITSDRKVIHPSFKEEDA